MPFQYILANLLARSEETIGVLFLDQTGETVDLACADLTPHDMRVVGAYMSIYLRQLERFLEAEVFGQTRVLHIESSGLHIYARPLPEGYFLVLVQRAPAQVGRARLDLGEAADELGREIFQQTT